MKTINKQLPQQANLYTIRLSELQEKSNLFAPIAADILLQKLNHPALKFLFAATGKGLPYKTAASARVAQLTCP